MTIDLISDMITRLRNAAIINKKLISLPFNKNNYIIIKILEREGYIFCSTFINNKDKLFLKLLELIFIKKNFSYNDTRVKNFLFFIRNFVKIHQHPENIKKYSRSEKKTLSFLNTIDNNLIKGENFSDLADPMSSLISKFRDSYVEHKKVNSGGVKGIFNSFYPPGTKSNSSAHRHQELQTANPKIDTVSSLASASSPFSSSERGEKWGTEKKDLLVGNNILDYMDVNFFINHLSTSTIELKKNLDDIYSNLDRIKVNSKSDDTSSNLARFFAAARQIDKTLDDMYSNLTKLNESSLNLFKNDGNKSENIISTLINFQKSLDETHSLIPMPVSMRKISKNININDLEFSLTKLNKHKDDINSYLLYLSKNTDDLQFYIKRSCQQVAKLNLNLRTNKYSNELSVIANKQQKNLENLKQNFRHELNNNLDDIIFYFNRLAKMLNTITSTFNLTEIKKYFGIKSMQASTKLKNNSLSNSHNSDDIDIKSYISHLPSIKLELKNNLDFVTSKFSELKKNFNDVKSMQAPMQTSPGSPSLKIEEEKRLKKIFDDVNSTLTHLPSDLLEFSNHAQIDDINAYISRLSAAMVELNDIQANFNDSSTKENINLTDSNSIDKPLKMNERSRKLKKRLKPEEKITYYYDPIQGKNTFLPFALNKNGDSINPSISPLEKKEPKKPLNLQKYLRKKNNKTFQTLFNPNYSKIILLALNLNAKEKSSIHGIRRISKPSLRCYSSNPIPRSFGGLGVFIVSTNCGIMTDNEAREKKLGGEIMLEIW